MFYVTFELQAPDGCLVRSIEKGVRAFVRHMGSLHVEQGSLRLRHRFVTSFYRYDRCRAVQLPSVDWGRDRLSEDVGVRRR